MAFVAITAWNVPKSVKSHESEPSILEKETVHWWLRLIEWVRGSSMSRIAASLPDGVFWGPEGISRVSSPSKRRREWHAYVRICVTGEFESSMVQVHVDFYDSLRDKLQKVGKRERRGGKQRSTWSREREIGGREEVVVEGKESRLFLTKYLLISCESSNHSEPSSTSSTFSVNHSLIYLIYLFAS